MRNWAVLLVLLGLPQAAMAQISPAEEIELRDLALGFRDDPTIDRIQSIAALVDRARGGTTSGTLGFGFYPGALQAMASPVPLVAADSVATRCITHYTSTIPGTAPPDGDDLFTLSRADNGWVDVVFNGSDAGGTLTLGFRSDGADYVIEQLVLEDSVNRLDMEPVAEGLRDRVSGQVIPANSPDYVAFISMFEAVIANNPSWFIEEGQVTLGQPWIGGDSPEEAYRSASAILGAVAGNGAGLGEITIAGGATGQTLWNDRPGLVFEFVGHAPLFLQGRDPMDMALSGYEVFDTGSLFRIASFYAIDVPIGDRMLQVEQTQECTLQ